MCGEERFFKRTDGKAASGREPSGRISPRMLPVRSAQGLPVMASAPSWKLTAPAAFVCAAAQPVLAWNDRGHMLSALIAYTELKPEVREKVNAILRAHPQRDRLIRGGPAEGPDLDAWVFAMGATWPDMLRGRDNPMGTKEHHGTWHYVNFPISVGGVTGPTPEETWDGKSDPANIVMAMAKCSAELKAEATTADRRAMSLCWVEHLVGDIHQPLHATNLYSPQFPQGDRGGNSFAVKRGSSPTNLHSYWDNSLGTGIELASLKAQIDGFKVNPELTRAKLFGDKLSTDFSAWTQESLTLAREVVYRNGDLKGAAHTEGPYAADTPELPSDYEATVKKAAAGQVVRAGYRLADVLNAALTDRSPVAPPTEKP